MTLALSKALEDGARAVVCASTGNTSASAAAYAARAGLRCAVVVPAGAIALGKLAQAQACGARVVAIDGTFDDALAAVRELADRPPGHARQQPQPVPPRGSEDGGVRDRRRARRRARTGCACRSATAATSRRTGAASASRSTVATPRARRACSAARPRARRRSCAASMVDAPRDGRDGDPDRPPGALPGGEGGRRASPRAPRSPCRTRRSSRRSRRLPETEGVFCEPASAASLAGLVQRARRRGSIEDGARVVCILTGHGLKDPDTAVAQTRGAVRCGRGLRGRRGGRAPRLRPRKLYQNDRASLARVDRPAVWGLCSFLASTPALRRPGSRSCPLGDPELAR